LGSLGGSGSNAAGYTCLGRFVLDGHRHLVTIPGQSLLAPGSTVRLVTVRSNPRLVASIDQMKTEHTTWVGFILPTVLLVVLAALVAAIGLRSRRRSSQS
jgi:hypothetical protein